jgi:hypothetical protein
VLLSLRPSSYAKAKAYLADIGVGTASIPPTATMRDDFEHRWRELAETLIYKIKMTRSLLKKRSIPKIQKSLENELSEANKWKQVLDYPPQLNKQTASKWWEVAGKMLKVHWEAHPVEKKADFEKVKKSAEAAGETSEAYAHRQVRIIFHSLAAKGDKGNDER